MPNPLSAVHPHPDLTVTPLAVGDDPALARQLALIVGTWAQVENGLGLTLARLMGAQAQIGVAVYSALSGGTARQAALRAAGVTLPAEDGAVFDALLAITRACAKERNTLVHDLWTRSDALPGRLLIVPQSHWLAFRARTALPLDAPAWFASPPPAETLFDAVQVYSGTELEALRERMEALIKHLAWFRDLLGVESPARDESRRRLAHEPAIRSWMARKTASTPAAPLPLQPPLPPETT